jgi:predicted acyl esterase
MHYPSAENKLFHSYSGKSEYVTMSDGVKIAVDIFIPKEGPDQTEFPVVLAYTPYQRSHIDRETGKVSDLASSQLSKLLLAQGYALVCADIRGTGASTGWLLDFMPEIWSDGKEIVEWISNQTWCDGNVGMMGGSYLGWSQTATAAMQPKALKCIMPAVVPLEGYTGEVYPGGIYLDGFMKSWSQYQYLTTRNYYSDDVKVLTKPVVDEDKDGELVDEIPLDLNNNGLFLDDGYPPKYIDNGKRAHIYYNLTKEHDDQNFDYTEWTRDVYFYDAKSPLGYSVFELGPTAHVHGIMESGIPVYNVGGWFDGFARGSFELYETMKSKNPSKIIMGPGYHDYSGGPFWGLFNIEDKEARRIYHIEHLRFFDRYLKGIENNIENEPPILIYVMNGQGWRFENEWPLNRREEKKLYLGYNSRLLINADEIGSQKHLADFGHSSVYGSNNGNRWLGIAAHEPDSLPYRTELDKSCLSFNSDPQQIAIEVTGHPIVNLFVSSTADYGDFYVYLCDVDEEGQSLLVTEGQLRAGFAQLHDNDIMIKTHKGINVLPELPWHGFEKDQYLDGILRDGKIVELRFDLQPTSWVFQKGHKIRLSIACADYPTFRLHPKLSPGNDPDDPGNIIPEITVYFGSDQTSFLQLPVIPK